MLRGDLATMSLADLLQWVDATRKSVVIEIERGGDGASTRTWLVAVERQIVGASAPIASGTLAADGRPGAPGPGLRAIAVENLLDLFFEERAEFVLRDGASPPEPGVPLELSIGFLVMEALRQLDEWPRIEAQYAEDTARLRSRSLDTSAAAAELSVVQREILRAAQDGRTLGELRVVLGLSRRALLRRVDELAAIGLVEIEGSDAAPDLPSTLLEQARVLMRERQFAEAAYVLRSLLATSPDDAPLRHLLNECEQRHVADCYATAAPSDLVRLAGGARAALPPPEQAIVDVLAQKPRSVAGLVLISPLRELDTLVALLRLAKRGVVELQRDD